MKVKVGDKFNSTYVPETIIEVTQVLPTAIVAKVNAPADIAGRIICDDINHFPRHWQRAA
jgi:hypothetical protein